MKHLDGPVLPKLIGARVRRREDPRLVQGQAAYVDDLKLPGMLHAAFKRSEIAHGNIRVIDTSAAESISGVELVLTGAQLAEHIGPIPRVSAIRAPNQHPLAIDRVRYVGEPVAVVVAADRYIAGDAVDAIRITYEELPAVVDPHAAVAEDAVRLHEGFERNIALDRFRGGTPVDPATAREGDDDAVAAAFAGADVVVKQSMLNQRLAPSATEPRGVVAEFDHGRDYLTIWSSTQAPHLLRSMVARVLGLGEHQVRAIAPEVGGGFGAKKVYGEDHVVAALSRIVRAPVKWIEDRTEAFLTTSHGRDIHGDIEIAARRDGSILAVRAKLVADIGAYQALMTAAIPTNAGRMISGVYSIPLIHHELTEVFTNKTPTDAYRGAGRPEGIYFLERAVDMLARELEIDPAEIRRRNFVATDQFPYRTATGLVYDSGNYRLNLELALEIAGWDALMAERDAARAEGRIVGVGLACFVEICGRGPSAPGGTGGWEHSAVTVERGGKVSATTGTTSHGQGHETTFAQMLADHFSIPIEDIAILHGDTGVVKQGVGTFGSRSQAVGGTALLKAAQKAGAKMKQFAAALMADDEVETADLEFANGRIQAAGRPQIWRSFADVADFAYIPVPLPPGLEPGLSEEAFFEPENNTYPFGCHISMIEIDPGTGVPKLLKLTAVDDCGNVINPLIVEGQIQGGLAQGIGQAMFEEVVFDQDGQPLTASFMDYVMPRAADLPVFQLARTVTPTPLNPLGAKGVGEAGTIGAAPCLANAAVDALAPFGVRHVEMPLRPERLWRLIQAGRRRA
ncbi:MAG: molybdopterin-dependent oxidoreductase [Chloroflexi bacterium]|nr:molybdopterin-dependent oxidoreductase [Chloroflexota bacterium]